MILVTVFALAALQQPTTTPRAPDVSSVTADQTTDGKPWPPPGVLMSTPGSGVVAPVALTNPKPAYTPEALAKKISGDVWLQMIVEADGNVGEVRVNRSLETGLDAEAVKAAKRYKFKPGTKDGEPVPVLVTVIITFQVRERPPTAQ